MKKHVESVAILIDGGYFLKRYGSLVDPAREHSVAQVANSIYTFALRHAGDDQLYRIFYYDCVPFNGKACNPVSKKQIDFKKTPQFQFRNSLFEALMVKRKVALRLGKLKDSKNWSLRAGLAKDLIVGKLKISDIKESDVSYDLRQKGIDMKIGIDIASLAFKKLVSRIVLIAGDADFVPASKLARREGIDFILDPMWNNIDLSLLEHVDGLRSTCPKPKDFRSITALV